MQGSGLISKTVANVFGVCKNVAYSFDERGLLLKAGCTLNRLFYYLAETRW